MHRLARCLVRPVVAAVVCAVIVGGFTLNMAVGSPDIWRSEWPRTDFTKHSISLAEIRSGGPSKDGIPSIDQPRFERLASGRVSGWLSNIGATEPVISLTVEGEVRAYPLRIMIWHEIVNDRIGETAVAVTYCPLCNASLVFNRDVEGQTLSFGTTGKLRNSDLVMYDRQTESWWQQFSGEAIVGSMTGRALRLIPSRLESFARLRERSPNAQVLVPENPNARRYGVNPYVGYDAPGTQPFLYDGSMPPGIEPTERVVAVETAPGRHEAWSLGLLQRRGIVEAGDVVITWVAGQASILDKASVSAGRDVGNVTVQRKRAGILVDIPYDVPFAFAFHAFRPKALIHK